MHQKLQTLLERHEELAVNLSDAQTLQQPEKFRELSKEYAQLEQLVQTFKKYENTLQQQHAAEEFLNDPNIEMRAMAEEDLIEFNYQLNQLEQTLYLLLLPQDPADHYNIFLEIRAGTGGDEAAIFAGDLLRMYLRYSEKQHWIVDIVHASAGEYGGYKEIILRVSGKNVYSRLKFESGGHRVQRVPLTESQGRIHTSACTIAVLPEVPEIEVKPLNSTDLKIDTYRASGAGGQHVNKTESAIRITHIPTGIIVECQEDRSQNKNRAKAMALLQAKLFASEKMQQEAQQAATRRSLVGSGDRSERIRTYNFPQNRLTEHRINLTLYKLSEIMDGQLDEIINLLSHEHQIDLLAQFE